MCKSVMLAMTDVFKRFGKRMEYVKHYLEKGSHYPGLSHADRRSVFDFSKRMEQRGDKIFRIWDPDKVREVVTDWEKVLVILNHYHKDASGNHLGAHTTTERIRLYYEWMGMTKDVRDYVASCPKCRPMTYNKEARLGGFESKPAYTEESSQPDYADLTGIEGEVEEIQAEAPEGEGGGGEEGERPPPHQHIGESGVAAADTPWRIESVTTVTIKDDEPMTENIGGRRATADEEQLQTTDFEEDIPLHVTFQQDFVQTPNASKTAYTTQENVPGTSTTYHRPTDHPSESKRRRKLPENEPMQLSKAAKNRKDNVSTSEEMQGVQTEKRKHELEMAVLEYQLQAAKEKHTMEMELMRTQMASARMEQLRLYYQLRKMEAELGVPAGEGADKLKTINVQHPGAS